MLTTWALKWLWQKKRNFCNKLCCNKAAITHFSFFSVRSVINTNANLVASATKQKQNHEIDDDR